VTASVEQHVAALRIAWRTATAEERAAIQADAAAVQVLANAFREAGVIAEQ
jgi:hypothetical protein